MQEPHPGRTTWGESSRPAKPGKTVWPAAAGFGVRAGAPSPSEPEGTAGPLLDSRVKPSLVLSQWLGGLVDRTSVGDLMSTVPYTPVVRVIAVPVVNHVTWLILRL